MLTYDNVDRLDVQRIWSRLDLKHPDVLAEGPILATYEHGKGNAGDARALYSGLWSRTPDTNPANQGRKPWYPTFPLITIDGPVIIPSPSEEREMPVLSPVSRSYIHKNSIRSNSKEQIKQFKE